VAALATSSTAGKISTLTSDSKSTRIPLPLPLPQVRVLGPLLVPSAIYFLSVTVLVLLEEVLREREELMEKESECDGEKRKRAKSALAAETDTLVGM